MKVLVTGAKGFIGKNLIAELNNKGYADVLEFDKDTNKLLLDKYTKECEFVFHLAGVNRPKDEKEFMGENFGFTQELLDLLKKHKNCSPILMTSSIQAEKDLPYGISKKAGEELLFNYHRETGNSVLVYRLSNVFGKWCRPNYNSVVATFCHNIARGLQIQINDSETVLNLCYIDNVIDEFIKALKGEVKKNGEFCYIPVTYKIKLGELADKFYAFRKTRDTLVLPSIESEFDRILYATYLTYLEKEDFSYKLKKNTDNRGWLTEFIKSKSMGQIFVSKTKPGITRGNHWHHTKTEKFLVLQGEAIIKFRKIGNDEVIEYKVNGEIPEVVDIPAGYTHSIINIGKDEVITLFWASEILNTDKPDTYYLEV